MSVNPRSAMEHAALERGLPVNIDAERFILGSVMLDDARFIEIAGVIMEEDFALEKHRRIFRRLLQQHRHWRRCARSANLNLMRVILIQCLHAPRLASVARRVLACHTFPALRAGASTIAIMLLRSVCCATSAQNRLAAVNRLHIVNS